MSLIGDGAAAEESLDRVGLLVDVAMSSLPVRA